ncbi:cupin domain-containing protein [Rheinheimera marina]|uniref:Cupin domain-containing protein n=1 Tax=Rheinheimera marina TaxID=1774958 RepID=A0ABV9JHE4_9GAMM
MTTLMKSALYTAALSSAGFAMDAASAQSEPTVQAQQVRPQGSQPGMQGPQQLFTGTAQIAPLFPGTAEINASGAYVTFEAGARTAWHTHPKGQHIIVTQGVGYTQQWGQPVTQIKVGDVVWCPPGVKHWHGAAADSAMTHLVVTGQDEEGRNVVWLEKVSDAEYSGARDINNEQ